MFIGTPLQEGREILFAFICLNAFSRSTHITENMKHPDDVSIQDVIQDVFFRRREYVPVPPHKFVPPPVYVTQAPGPGIAISIWENFRELPKPLGWSEADSREYYLPQDSAEWERTWSNVGLDSLLRYDGGPGSLPVNEWKHTHDGVTLDLKELVSRPCVPGFEDGPRPLRLWEKASSVHNSTRFPMDSKTYPVSVPDYVYTPLRNDDEIRILDILPGEGNDPLAFNLRTVNLLDPATKYEALSYVWGTAMVDVVCEGKRFSFPHSLYRALVALRDCTEVRSIWADSICINQKNDQEKSRQVRMMRKIFRQAHRVLIWLDERDSHVAQVTFELAGRLHQRQLRNIPPPQSPIWGVFIRLFDNKWFSRIWCLQEIVLAPSALVIWGPASAPWEHVGFSAGWLCNVGYEIISGWIAKVGQHQLGLNEGLESHYRPGIYRASLMYSLWSAMNSEAGLAKPVSFYDLLCETRPFEATDPRDKVFALVGIPTADADPEGSHCFVEPDYSKTIEEVFVDAAKRILARNTGSLHLLGAVQHQPNGCKATASLPTWVPDWSLFRSRSLVPSTVYEHGRLPVSRPLRMDELSLLVSGVIVDTVTYVESLTSRDDIMGIISSLTKAWGEMNKLFDVYPGGADMSEAFCWTITAGNNWLGQRVTGTDRGQHIADYKAFRDQGSAIIWRFPVLETPQQVTRAVKPDARRYYEALCHACSNRSIFITQKGYMGLGPGSIEPGAEIALLSGAQLPMILTRCRSRSRGSNLHGYTMLNTHDNLASSESIMGSLGTRDEGSVPSSNVFPEPTFNVVGESYIYGLMDGQIEINASDCEDIRLT